MQFRVVNVHSSWIVVQGGMGDDDTVEWIAELASEVPRLRLGCVEECHVRAKFGALSSELRDSLTTRGNKD
jgi:hypothetical protein